MRLSVKEVLYHWFFSSQYSTEQELRAESLLRADHKEYEELDFDNADDCHPAVHTCQPDIHPLRQRRQIEAKSQRF